MPATRRRPHPARLPSARRPPPRRHPNPAPPRRPSRLRRKTDIPSSRRFGAAGYLASVSPQGVRFLPPLVTRPEGVERAQPAFVRAIRASFAGCCIGAAIRPPLQWLVTSLVRRKRLQSGPPAKPAIKSGILGGNTHEEV